MKKFVAIGQVDAGKSNLCGHLLYKCGYVDERTMEKIRIKAQEDGASTCIYSRVLDIYEEEQERGKTYEFDTVTFNYKDKQYQLIDTPGHQKFVRSMIEGISQHVNIAVLLISMKENEFEAAFGSGMMKEHMVLCRAMGIEYMILAANKMDLIDWDEKRCKQKVMEVTKYLVKNLGWPKENLFVVPISAFQGIGLVDTVGIPEWYKGKSFLDTLDSLPDKPKEIITDLVESDRFVCEVNTFAIEGNIMTPGYLCIAHFNGQENEVTIEKIQGKPFLRGMEKAKCILKLPQKEKLAIGMRVIYRKGVNTVGYGRITAIK
jgi:small GTP-binding protein